MGQPIRVSQALSIVMALVSVGMLVYNIKLRPHDPADLLVNQVAAARADAEAAEPSETEEAPEAAVPQAETEKQEDEPDGSADGR